MPQLDDQHRRQLRIALDQREVQLDEAREPRRRSPFPRQLIASFRQQLGHLLVEETQQQVVFPLEIQIDGSIGHAGGAGDLGDGRGVEPALGEDLDGRVHDPPALVVQRRFHVADPAQRRVMLAHERARLNEGSFR